MLLKEVLENSSEHIDLQALIMFLVFEKQVLSLEDDSKELELYFLPKHRERMNKELIAYKNKLKMKYNNSVYEVTSGKYKFYIYATNDNHAIYIAQKYKIKVDSIDVCNLDQLMCFNGKQTKLRELTKGIRPKILGGYKC